MRLKIVHTTRYDFDQPVSYGLQQIRKTPKTNGNQKVETWSTVVTGGKKELQFEDFHRNVVELISFEPGATAMEIRSEGIVELEDYKGIVGPHVGLAPLWLFQRPTARTRAGAGCREIIRRVVGDDVVTRLHDLSRHIQDAVEYVVGASEPDWTAEDAVAAGKGVCQDHAHIFVACARVMGVPARYVSGYLMMDDRTHQDATHAWAEAYVEGLGWVGFDVSNGISPDTRYVRIATGLDYGEAAPVRGMRFGGVGESLSVSVAVEEQQQQ